MLDAVLHVMILLAVHVPDGNQFSVENIAQCPVSRDISQLYKDCGGGGGGNYNTECTKWIQHGIKLLLIVSLHI